MANKMVEIITYGVLAIFGAYVLSRIISFAIAKSWFQVKHSHQNKEEENGEEKEEEQIP